MDINVENLRGGRGTARRRNGEGLGLHPVLQTHGSSGAEGRFSVSLEAAPRGQDVSISLAKSRSLGAEMLEPLTLSR